MADAHRDDGSLKFEDAQRLRGQGLAQSEIGRRYGVSRQYVHKLLKRGLVDRSRSTSDREPRTRCVSTCPSTPAVNQLTVRECKFAKGLMEGKTQKTAALEAVPEGSVTPGSAEQWASRTVRKPRFQRGLREILDDAGLTEKAIARVHAENLYAKKVIAWGKDEDGHTLPIEYPDYRVRQRAVDAGWKLYRTEVPPAPPEHRPARLTVEQANMFKKGIMSDESLALAVANGVIEIISDEEAAEEAKALKAPETFRGG